MHVVSHHVPPHYYRHITTAYPPIARVVDRQFDIHFSYGFGFMVQYLRLSVSGKGERVRFRVQG